LFTLDELLMSLRNPEETLSLMFDILLKRYYASADRYL